MDFKAASTRIRRTFAYPSDTTTESPSSSRHLSPDNDDDDTNGPALDEQEQEELIQALVQQNAERNAQFRLFLLLLPALSTIPYFLILGSSLSSLLSRSNNNNGNSGRTTTRGVAADIWIAFLALSSLASTAWTLWSLPPGVTGIRVLDAWAGSNNINPSSTSSSSSQGPGPTLLGPNARRRRAASNASSSPSFWAHQLHHHHRSPLQQYLPYLNIALCALLILIGILSSSRRPSSAAAVQQHWGHVGVANLPALVYAVVLVAKVLMGSIDPERELSALRYEYKGA